MSHAFDAAHAEKRHAALSSLYWAAFLTSMKLGAGLYTNSLGLLSEAAHSGMDLLAAAMTYIAVRVAGRPADISHPYGYGKIENLSALLETLLLLLTCGWIIYEGVERLFFNAAQVIPSALGIGVMLISIIVDISRSRMLKRVGEEHKSQALLADALHFSSDIWSSTVVLIGLIALWASSFITPGILNRSLLHADALAALIVSCIVLYVSIGMARRAITALLDGGGNAHYEAIRAILLRIPGVSGIRHLRVRESGADAFVDMTLFVPAQWKLEAAHDISVRAERAVQEIIEDADVVVHVEPDAADIPQTMVDSIDNIAAIHNLSVHNIQLTMLDEEGLVVELHVELDPDEKLRSAHQRVTLLEIALAERLQAAQVITHLEPERSQNRGNGKRIPNEEIAQMQAVLTQTLDKMPEMSGCHKVQFYRNAGRLILNFHCYMDPEVSVACAHDAVNKLEYTLHTVLPALSRIIIHVEPTEG